MLLKNKNILVAVTGSIAIYKALELIRLYIKAGANVKVIMTNGAKKFINPITFEAISQNKVLDENSESWSGDEGYNHIDIGKWADVFVIAPCSANTVNKIANGVADNFLTQAVLAYGKKSSSILLAYSANTNMLSNEITQKSLQSLDKLGFTLISSQTKKLVCKDVGDGAMADIEDIFYSTTRELLKDEYWIGRSTILSGGGTIEKIDEVRYISNFSSGKMASSLALALYLKGADVTLVATRGYENLPKAINVLAVQSSQEMYENLDVFVKNIDENSKKPYFFMVSAVSDYIPSDPKEGKIKKESLGSIWNLKLKKNIDILKSLDKNSLISIGFKAEMDKENALENATNALDKKGLDAICLNILENSNSFGTSDNEIKLITRDKSFDLKGDKLDLSLDILEKCKEKWEVL